MIGKKDTIDIFGMYKNIILEQVQDGGISDILNRIKTSSLNPKTKQHLVDLLSNPNVANIYKTIISQQPVGDADTAGYSSYPEAEPIKEYYTSPDQAKGMMGDDDDNTPFEYEGETYTNPTWKWQIEAASKELPRNLNDVEEKLGYTLIYFKYLLDYLKKNDPEDMYQMTKGIIDTVIKPSIKIISKHTEPNGGFGAAWDSK